MFIIIHEKCARRRSWVVHMALQQTDGCLAEVSSIALWADVSRRKISDFYIKTLTYFVAECKGQNCL